MDNCREILQAPRMFVVKLRSVVLSLPRKLLFEHVPKCGGSSVVYFLRSQYPTGRTYLIGADQAADISRFLSLPEKKRFAYDLVVGHGSHRLRNHVHPDTLKATILRDPVDRVVSHYFYVLRSPEHYLHEAVAGAGLSLEEYVSSGMSTELHNHYVTSFLGISEAEARRDVDASVNRAYELIRRDYAVVGALDQLEATVNRIGKLLGFLDSFNTGNRNVTSGRPEVEEVSQEALVTIRRINSMDIALYEMIRKDVRGVS